MKIAICDDKPLLHNDLKKCLEKYAKDRRLVFVYDDFTNGSDLLASRIEFLTGFPHIVFDAFEVNTYRFLVKPIDMEKLSSAMDDYLADHDDDKFIIIKTDDNNRRIRIDDIIYAEASDKYCCIRTADENILFKKTLSEFEKLLPQDRFFRTHRTYLVGFRHIVSHTSADILFDNKEKALISKLKYGAFKKAFVDYVKRFNFAGR